MDWHSWLSKTSLEPALAYEYALLFAQNELGQDDTVHFDHEFLQSMGISIAKHRLEILKLAKEKRGPPLPVAKLVAVMKKTKKCLTNYIHALSQHDSSDQSSALVLLSKPSTIGFGSGWSSAMLKRKKKKVVVVKQDRLMITDHSSVGNGGSLQHYSCSQSASPMVYNWHESNYCNVVDDDDDGDEFWDSAEAEKPTRWDSMFQNLKPT